MITCTSLAKGAFCQARVGRDISEALWHSGTKRGHTRLSPLRPDDARAGEQPSHSGTEGSRARPSPLRPGDLSPKAPAGEQPPRSGTEGGHTQPTSQSSCWRSALALQRPDDPSSQVPCRWAATLNLVP